MGQNGARSLQTTKTSKQEAAIFLYFTPPLIWCNATAFVRAQALMKHEAFKGPHEKTAGNCFALHPPERRVAVDSARPHVTVEQPRARKVNFTD